MSHTRFPKEDHLPDSERRDNKATKGDRVDHHSGFKRFYTRHIPCFPPYKILQVIKHTLVISKAFCRFNRLNFSALTAGIILGNTVRGKKNTFYEARNTVSTVKLLPCKPLRRIGGGEWNYSSTHDLGTRWR